MRRCLIGSFADRLLTYTFLAQVVEPLKKHILDGYKSKTLDSHLRVYKELENDLTNLSRYRSAPWS